jgi:hypothetical protein
VANVPHRKPMCGESLSRNAVASIAFGDLQSQEPQSSIPVVGAESIYPSHDPETMHR